MSSVIRGSDGFDTANLGTTAGSLTTNGYAYLPNGLIIQWGITASIGVGGSATVTFPIAFPSACKSVTTARVEASSANSYGISVSSASTTSVVIYSNGARAGAQYWTAIGY